MPLHNLHLRCKTLTPLVWFVNACVFLFDYKAFQIFDRFLRMVWFFAEPVADASAEIASMFSTHWCNVEVLEGLLRIVRPTSNALSHSLSTVCWPNVFTSKLRCFLVFWLLASLRAFMFCYLLKLCKVETTYKVPAIHWPINTVSSVKMFAKHDTW